MGGGEQVGLSEGHIIMFTLQKSIYMHINRAERGQGWRWGRGKSAVRERTFYDY